RALDPEGARGAGGAPREGEGDRALRPRRRGDACRHLPRLAGLRRQVLQRCDRCGADGDADFRRMHENRRFRSLAAAQTAGRSQGAAGTLIRKGGGTMTFNRRRFIQATGAGVSASVLPSFALAQGAPIRLGLMTVKTGPLASGGIDMERALVQYLKEHNYTMAGRKVELFVGDSGGVPAQSRTKLQELVERDKIQVLIGPLDTASALASDDYIRQQDRKSTRLNS